ncbi:sigma-54-dependent Fis family transcriptional regulator [Candidatus Poribacteria bacterium]|nr:sigma-54-dependent Fis family transcriptional regulator [Candidatus Poribacteria bacterium]
MTLHLETAVWREVCRHSHIGETVSAVAAILTPSGSIRSLAVRRVVTDSRAIQTVGTGGKLPAGRKWDHAARTPAASHFRALTRFAASGSVASQLPDGGGEGWLRAAVPREMALPVWVCGLPDRQGGGGILCLGLTPACAERDWSFLREPLAAALENDRRLHELTALKEAAEADRRSLLGKLGRRELSEPVLGAQGGLRLVWERATTAAPLEVPVLILGETGSGKEVIARAIHEHSSRAGGPFIRVNCGAIPHELIDSELFGHEKGSFTGAIASRRGWFEQADRGTLFLDEVGELSPQAQVRLLRVLQEGTLTRVGAESPIHVEVRVISATNRDLSQMVREGSFRQDLWYRLAVFPILLPPLRDRLEDLPELARHFAERASRRFGLTLRLPTADDLRLLVAYPWPGNIRELQAVIDRAAILGGGRHLDIARSLGVLGTPDAVSAIAFSGSSGAIETLDAATKMHIERALRQTRGKVNGAGGAAEMLAIHPNTLRARMKVLGVEWRKHRNPA